MEDIIEVIKSRKGVRSYKKEIFPAQQLWRFLRREKGHLKCAS